MATQQDAAHWLPTTTGELVTSASSHAREVLGEAFVASVLVGNAMHPERADRGQRPELVIVARELPATKVAGLAGALRNEIRKGLRPRLLTTTELERGADVFALELAEWKTRHWLVDGADPFGEIAIERGHLRHAIEFQLRGLGRRLRNRVLVGMSQKGRVETRRAVQDALDTLAVCCHHTLVCVGKEAPTLDGEAISALARRAEVDGAGVLGLVEEVRAKGSIGDLEGALAAVLPFVEAVADFVDRMPAR